MCVRYINEQIEGIPRHTKYMLEVWSTLQYHFLKLLMPLVIAFLTLQKHGCSAILSYHLIINLRDGIICQIVGKHSLEKVC